MLVPSDTTADVPPVPMEPSSPSEEPRLPEDEVEQVLHDITAEVQASSTESAAQRLYKATVEDYDDSEDESESDTDGSSDSEGEDEETEDENSEEYEAISVWDELQEAFLMENILSGVWYIYCKCIRSFIRYAS